MSKFPPPKAYGLPEHFEEFREGQFEAIQNSKASKKRVVGQAAPTGVGKSLILMGEAMMSQGRNLILTSTKPLQDQYAEQFQEITTDLRGQQNYLCVACQPGGEHYAPYIPVGTTVDEGPCHFGQGCSLLLGGCTYYDRIKQASLAHNVISNYDLILSVNKYTEGIGPFNFVACDEAHEIPEKLASIMAAEITDWEAKTILRQELFPSTDPIYWANWASRMRVQVARTIDGLKEGSDIDTPEVRFRMKSLTRVARSLSQMSVAEKDWIVEADNARVRVEPLWPRRFVEPYLLGGAYKIVFSSATIRPKLFGLLGIEDYDFFEYPSPFKVEDRPVWYVPTSWMRYDMENTDKLKMVRAVDQIISRRLDRKIIIPTTSFALQKFLVAHSRYGAYMITNNKALDGRSDTRETLNRFREAKAPAILVSPSISTGVDFPGDQCETIIIIKVPFPDVSSHVYKARSRDDSEYGPYIAVQTLVQMAGRGMRSKNDRCECVSPETRVLTKDLKWIPAGNLQVGDNLLAFDEESSGRDNPRRWRWSKVIKAVTKDMPRIKITLKDGSSLICTPNHPWLLFNRNRTQGWVKAENIKSGDRLLKFLDPWNANTTYEAGWLSGFYDGEGCLTLRAGNRNPNVVGVWATQNAGPIQHRLEKYLEILGFNSYVQKASGSWSDKYGNKIRTTKLVGGLHENLKFLGSIRPERLLLKFIESERNEALQRIDAVEVTSVEILNDGPITSLQTSTATFIAEGFGAHNTIILDGTFGSLKHQYSHLFPSWFLTAVRKSDMLPAPLEKL